MVSRRAGLGLVISLIALGCGAGLSNGDDPALPGSGGTAGRNGGTAGTPNGTGGLPAGGRGGAADSSAGGAGSGGTAGAAGGTSGGTGGVAAGTGGAAGAVVIPPNGELDYLKKVVPVLMITYTGTLSSAVKTNATFKLIEDHDGTLTNIATATPTASGQLGIDKHGFSSLNNYAQTPYGIELRDGMGMSMAISILGIPKGSDFILHSCYSDKPCMRNALTYQLAREIGAPAGRWAERTRYVELYLNGMYNGLYLLVESIKRGKNRVDVPAPALDATGDLTGGYIFSFEANRDRGGPMGSWLEVDPLAKVGTQQLPAYWAYRSPHRDNITGPQRMYISKAWSDLERTIIAVPKWATIKDKIDPTSFLDHLAIEEISNSADAYRYNWFWVKPPDSQNGGKFFVGPPWDMDAAWGNMDKAYWGSPHWCTTTFLSSTKSDGAPPDLPAWKAVFRDPELHNASRCRYLELRQPGKPFDLANIEAKIEAFRAHIATAKARDLAKWMNIPKKVFLNNYIGGTWADEIQFLRYWIRQRIIFMDKSSPGICTTVPLPPVVTPIAAPPQAPGFGTFPILAGGGNCP